MGHVSRGGRRPSHVVVSPRASFTRIAEVNDPPFQLAPLDPSLQVSLMALVIPVTSLIANCWSAPGKGPPVGHTRQFCMALEIRRGRKKKKQKSQTLYGRWASPSFDRERPSPRDAPRFSVCTISSSSRDYEPRFARLSRSLITLCAPDYPGLSTATGRTQAVHLRSTTSLP